MYQSVSKYSSVDIGFQGTRLNTVVMQTSPETLLLIQSGTITLISFDFTTGAPNKVTATASYLSQQSIKRKATFRGLQYFSIVTHDNRIVVGQVSGSNPTYALDRTDYTINNNFVPIGIHSVESSVAVTNSYIMYAAFLPPGASGMMRQVLKVHSNTVGYPELNQILVDGVQIWSIFYNEATQKVWITTPEGLIYTTVFNTVTNTIQMLTLFNDPNFQGVGPFLQIDTKDEILFTFEGEGILTSYYNPTKATNQFISFKRVLQIARPPATYSTQIIYLKSNNSYNIQGNPN